MRSLPARYEPAELEADGTRFWKSRGLPRPLPTAAAAGGLWVHQVVGALAAPDTALSFLQRAIRADAEARFLALSGHPSRGRLVSRRADHRAFGAVREGLAHHAVWVGGGALTTVGDLANPETLQGLVDRLAAEQLLVSRELPLRSCPSCRAPRSPEGIVYASEDGDAYLVRFLLEGPPPRTSLLVWIDSVWKLLGTSAVLVHPELPYVRLRYRRRGTEEIVLVLRSALPRLKGWLEGAETEVLDEQPGSKLAGLRYEHPLGTEFPTLSGLPSPAGQVAATPEVDDSGTGIVALVPGHGAGDAAVAARLGIPGWPVVGPDGTLVRDLQHKYSGLTVEMAEAFVLRDLAESGLMFAQLRVRRGVPHCAVCGSALYWQPSRAWCLDLSTVSAPLRERLGRVVPAESFVTEPDPVAWPVSEWRIAESPGAPRLLECGQCGRLAPISGSPAQCNCGANWKPVARRLLPSLEEPLAVWAASRPFPGGDPVRFYLAERRRQPSLTLQGIGTVAASAEPGDVRSVGLPTLPIDAESVSRVPEGGSDALRGALLRAETAPRSADPGLAGRRRQEDRRLRKVWQVAREVLERAVRDGVELDARPISGRLTELLEEDRAFLSLFERLRSDVQREFEAGRIARAQERLTAFFEEDLRREYLPLVRARLDAPGASAGKLAAHRVLGHTLPRWAELYAPIAPYTMEAIHRAFRGDGASLFERPYTPPQELLLDAPLEEAYARWRSLSATLDAYRRELGLDRNARLPAVVVSVPEEAVATELRSHRAVLERLARVDRVEISSPSQSWAGKRILARPVAEELQKAYPYQVNRLVRMLEGMSPARIQEGLRTRSLELVLEGHALPITAAMIELTEVLPEGVVAVPWTTGDLFVTVPPERLRRPDALPPALSPEAFRLLSVLRRRLARSEAPSAIDRVEISASGPLGDELVRSAASISRSLQGVEVLVTPDPGRFVRSETTFGRTRRGATWALWIPGLSVAVRSRARAPRPRRRRMRVPGPPIVADVTEDLLEEGRRARDGEIRDAVEAFDRLLGRPIVGPTKLAGAWEAGLSSFDAVAHAPYEQLVALPGFGPAVAAEIVRSSGGQLPARERRTTPTFAPQVSAPPPPAAAPSSASTREPVPVPFDAPPVEYAPDSVAEVAPVVEESVGVPAPPMPVVAPPVDLPQTAAGPVPVEAPQADQPPGTVEPVPVEAPQVDGPLAVPEPAPIEAPEVDQPPVTVEPVPVEAPQVDEPLAVPEPAPIEAPQVSHSPVTVEPAPVEAPQVDQPLVAVEPVPLAAPRVDLPTAVEPLPNEAPHVDQPLAGVTPAPTEELHVPRPVEEFPEAGAVGRAPSPEAPASPPVSPTEPTLIPPSPADATPSTSLPPVPEALAPPIAPLPPATPMVVVPPAAAPRPPVGVEAWSGTSADLPWAAFLDLTEGGAPGLCLSREFPERVRAALGTRNVRVVWLSNVGREGTVRPVDLEGLRAMFRNFLDEGSGRVAYLEGVEYLVRIHGPEKTLGLLRELDGLARSTQARLFVPVNPALMDPAGADRLLGEFGAGRPGDGGVTPVGA